MLPLAKGPDPLRETLRTLKMQGRSTTASTRGEACADYLAHDHAAAFKDSPEEKAMFEIGLEVSLPTVVVRLTAAS